MSFVDPDAKTVEDVINNFYHYVPSRVAGLAFLALFAITCLCHVFYLFRLRATYFIPMILGCILEAADYYGRSWSHENKTKVEPFIMQLLLLLVAPPVMAASIYMSLGRIMTAMDVKKQALVAPRRLTTIFVLNDVFCFLLQLGGAGVQVSTGANLREIGRKVIIAGLALQLVIFSFYILIIWTLFRRLKKSPTENSDTLHWRSQLWAQLIASFCIMVRSIFRLAEFVDLNGPAGKTEALIYVFDASLMWVAGSIFILIHPGRLIRQAQTLDKETAR
ncbi:RTA1 like protein-domain-containing protein [Protomyces lactucae-debilis]|uniref:RTA1 like protein-domain-containing protein n=1 Tax=Protomyces lactucae-debilis TaxID=2754530 RepID=A0A1Y2F3Y6_PROLT|nr:RTA1 like protein-domain-containing protein [Protomyces lactucae-debilis]ORY78591.1 RTA1 like protein-domain-containing protein [Protomyces lactucae-debilis]